MAQYIFILGRQPKLSLAEIGQVLPDSRLIFVNQQILILETDDINSPIALLDKLGGTIKVGKVVDRIKNMENKPEGELVDLLTKYLSDLARKKTSKFKFGLSMYNLSDKKLRNLGLTVKNKLKIQGIKARWVTSRESVLSSVVVTKQRLISSGVELLLIGGQNQEIYLGKTLAVQGFAEYSQRDYGRPARDARSGMLPPKLAKIMINLSGAGNKERILDPFCGSGTILQEAMLLDYHNLFASDINNQAVSDTKKNLAWLKQTKKIGPEFRIMIKKLSANQIAQQWSKDFFQAIITEPYLGPPQQRDSNPAQINKTISELSKLYLEFFKSAKQVLSPGGRLVIIFPVFSVNRQKKFLPIIEQIKKMGWQIVNPLPKAWQRYDSELLRLSDRGALIYSRPDQYVQREIFIFELI